MILFSAVTFTPEWGASYVCCPYAPRGNANRANLVLQMGNILADGYFPRNTGDQSPDDRSCKRCWTAGDEQLLNFCAILSQFVPFRHV